MKKGQISIDLILTLIIALMIVVAMWGIVNNFRTTQEKINVQTQLDEMTQKTASFITASQSIMDLKFNITYEVNKINYADANGNNKSAYPKMQIIDNNTLSSSITISTPYGEQVIDSNRTIYLAPTLTVLLDEVKTAGKIVIRNG